MDNQTKSLLLESAAEIKQLRFENNSMAARLDMFDKMILLFTTQPNYPGVGMSEDVIYKIEKHLTSMEIKR